MRRCLAVFYLLAILLLPTIAIAATQVAYVHTPDADALRRLAGYPVSIEESELPDWTRLAATPETIRELRKSGYEVEVIIDDLAAWAAARLSPPDPEDALPPNSRVALDHYLTYEEAAVFLQEEQAAYPDILSVETIGQSVLGRDLWLVKISDNVAENEAEPAVIFDHCIHGDELAGCMLGFFIIQWLTEGYGVDPEITALVDEREIFIVPTINPDGNQPEDYSRYNANGVDLNRNFGYFWLLIFTEGPHTEPETQALAAVWRRGQPFSFGASAHSGAVYFIYPWAYHYENAPAERELDYLGSQYCAVNSAMNLWGQASQLLGGAAYNTAMDEMLGLDGFLGTGIELTIRKDCAWPVAYLALQAQRPAVLSMIEEMSLGLHGEVVDGENLEPVEAVLQSGTRLPFYNDPDVGDFHNYLRPADYPLKVTANGYEEDYRLVSVVEELPTELTISLTRAARATTFAERLIECTMDKVNPPNPLIGYPMLGRPDGIFYSLGDLETAVFDLGTAGIADGPGPDIAVYEGQDIQGDEPFALYGSSEPYGPWTLIGEGLGTTEFDLADAGLDVVRYVQVQDTTQPAESKRSPLAVAGFDLDAVGSPPPLANFTVDSQFVLPGGEVQFADASRGEPTSRQWDFGDGETSPALNPAHTYADEGFYTVRLTIDGPRGSDSLVKNNFIAVVQPTIADFEAAPVDVSVGEAVHFTDRSTGYVNAYYWRFGDNYWSAEQMPTHAYSKPGDYTVALEVLGPFGTDEMVKTAYIHVAGADDDDDDDNDDNNDDNDDNDDTADDDDNDDNDNDDNDDGENADDGDGCGC